MAKSLLIKKWDRFWRLTIINETKKTNLKVNRRAFLLKCDCWWFITTTLDSLRIWYTKSCWCLRNEASLINIKKARSNSWLNRTHWMSKSKIYHVYQWIIDRCTNKNNNRWDCYWWRWIKCEWNTFEDFYKDMWSLYEEWLEIDRINVNLNYSNKNCRWVTAKQNSRNKQNTLWVYWLSLIEYCEIHWLNYKRIHARISRGKEIYDSLY